MSFIITNNYPVIKIWEYENYIQKFVFNSEEELFREIEHAIKFWIKKQIVDPKYWIMSFTMWWILDWNPSDFIAVFPEWTSLDWTKISWPYYTIHDNWDYVAYVWILPKK